MKTQRVLDVTVFHGVSHVAADLNYEGIFLLQFHYEF